MILTFITFPRTDGEAACQSNLSGDRWTPNLKNAKPNPSNKCSEARTIWRAPQPQNIPQFSVYCIYSPYNPLDEGTSNLKLRGSTLAVIWCSRNCTICAVQGFLIKSVTSTWSEEQIVWHCCWGLLVTCASLVPCTQHWLLLLVLLPMTVLWLLISTVNTAQLSMVRNLTHASLPLCRTLCCWLFRACWLLLCRALYPKILLTSQLRLLWPNLNSRG
jgi:hypothetical protein